MPVIKGSLKEADRTKLQTNWLDLLEELDSQYLAEFMFARGIFTFDDRTVTTNQLVTRRERTKLFLELLWDSGPKEAFDVFMETLDKHYPHLAEQLRKPQISESQMENSPGEKEINVATGSNSNQQGEESGNVSGDTHDIGCKDSLLRWKTECKKNPSHLSFIPVKSFSLHDLPEPFRFSEVLDYIRIMAAQTIRIIVRYTSTERPDGYVDAQMRGLPLWRFGSGRLWRIQKKFSRADNKTCPCTECLMKSPDQRMTAWGEYIVVTANYVIFNSQESEKSLCDLWFDKDEDTDKCSRLYGVEVKHSDIKTDFCEVVFVSCDEKVCRKLEDICRRNDELSMALNRTNHLRHLGEKLVVVVSHPHGLSKHITVGTWLDGENGRMDTASVQSYNAETCPGSGGAPVLFLSDRMSWFSTHSGSNKAGENQSGGRAWSL